MSRIPIVDTDIHAGTANVLMLRRAHWPEDKLDFLGGFVDEGEEIETAAIREVKEESGFDVELVKKFGVYDYTDRGEKRLHVFEGEVTGGTLQGSDEGVPEWVDLAKITKNDLAFPQVHLQVIQDILAEPS